MNVKRTIFVALIYQCETKEELSDNGLQVKANGLGIATIILKEFLHLNGNVFMS